MLSRAVSIILPSAPYIVALRLAMYSCGPLFVASPIISYPPPYRAGFTLTLLSAISLLLTRVIFSAGIITGSGAEEWSYCPDQGAEVAAVQMADKHPIEAPAILAR